MKTFLTLLGGLIFTGLTYCQAPEIDWAKAFGGSLNDYCYQVKMTPDGGYLLVGRSSSNNFDVGNNYGEIDGWVIKVDQTGAIEWEKNYGGSKQDLIKDFVVLNNNSGYVFLAQTDSEDFDLNPSPHSNVKTWIFKTDIDGNITDDLIVDHLSYDNTPASFLQNPNGDYLIISEQNQDILITQVTQDLSISWQKFYGGTDFESPTKIIATQDGGYAFVGYTKSSDGDIGNIYGTYDIWVVKINEFGTIQWEKNYGGTSEDYGRGLLESPDGSYTILGYTTSNDMDVPNFYGVADVLVIKTDEYGEVLWSKNYGGSQIDQATSILQTSSGNYLIAAVTNSNDGDITGHISEFDFWALQLNPLGDILWQKPLGGTQNEIPYATLINNQNQWVLAGQTDSNDVDVSGNHGGVDFWMVVLDNVLEVENHSLSRFSIYPNPTEDILYINVPNESSVTIQLYTAVGQSVNISTTQLDINSQNAIPVNLSSLSSGMYFLTVTGKNGSKTFKLIKK